MRAEATSRAPREQLEPRCAEHRGSYLVEESTCPASRNEHGVTAPRSPDFVKAVSGIAHPKNYNRLILVGRNRPMQTLKKLMNARGLYARCPNPACAESFPVPQAHLFDATKPLPDFAREHLAAQRTQIAEEWQRLRAERAEVKRRSFTSAASSGVGQTLEMMAASLPGLPVAPQDCRVLLKPLDYVAFSGASTGRVHSIRLIEVKSGQGGLSSVQRAIKASVESGKVRLRVANHRLPAD